MKTVTELAREVADKDKDDPVRHGLITLTFEEMQRFHDLAIAQYRKSLLAGVGDAVITKNTNGMTLHIGWDDVPINTKLYTADQLAAAVAIEREACAKVCERLDAEYEGEDVLATWCAAAIRGQL